MRSGGGGVAASRIIVAAVIIVAAGRLGGERVGSLEVEVVSHRERQCCEDVSADAFGAAGAMAESAVDSQHAVDVLYLAAAVVAHLPGSGSPRDGLP